MTVSMSRCGGHVSVILLKRPPSQTRDTLLIRALELCGLVPMAMPP